MKIAVINEVSASPKNPDIIAGLKHATNAEIVNVGMTNPEQQPQLTYIHTSYMAAILLNTGAVDFVVGGCGTGQGFMNAVLQFPKVTCGLIIDPLDAWLFSQINGGNCISLPLNKGYGWAADINLKYIFEKLFSDAAGGGYPVQRAESQAASRSILSRMSDITHHDIITILNNSDKDILKHLAATESFMNVLQNGHSTLSQDVAKLLRQA